MKNEGVNRRVDVSKMNKSNMASSVWEVYSFILSYIKAGHSYAFSVFLLVHQTTRATVIS